MNVQEFVEFMDHYTKDRYVQLELKSLISVYHCDMAVVDDNLLLDVLEKAFKKGFIIGVSSNMMRGDPNV